MVNGRFPPLETINTHLPGLQPLWVINRSHVARAAQRGAVAASASPAEGCSLTTEPLKQSLESTHVRGRPCRPFTGR